MKRLLILTAILTMMVGAANSQVLKPVKWQISFKKVSEGVYDIICKATVESGWHLYDTKLPENGPLPTTFNLASHQCTFTRSGETDNAENLSLFYGKTDVSGRLYRPVFCGKAFTKVFYLYHRFHLNCSPVPLKYLCYNLFINTPSRIILQLLL